jgi:enediyne biosynthesis protein E4
MNKLSFFLLFIAFAACKSNVKENKNLLFEALDATQTGVAFQNTLTETEQWNIIQYPYFYNGGGVAIGDINGDNLTDIYFTANQGSNKLYLNKGKFQFEDITDKAGVADTEGWKTGVTMVDINADGKLDIYVSHVSKYNGLVGKNRLFINKGDGTFEDKAAYYGLDATGFCTQAAFFDYDIDGDLDCFLLRHSIPNAMNISVDTMLNEKIDLSSDIFLKNYGGRFANETEKVGIKDGILGYGLGLSISDINGDGFPEIYVGNNAVDNDFIYYNNGNGTFTEGVKQSMGHTTHFSTGCDIADYNNDGYPDVVSMDRKPEEETILKASEGAEPYPMYMAKNKELGYHYQFSRNMLQLNRGSIVAASPKSFAGFSEIGQLAGIAATDWSWATLFADLDNDGLKDLYITNGILKRPNDLDFVNLKINREGQISDLDLLKNMPSGKASNYCFQNKGDLTFDNKSEAWGLNQYGLSNGAVYADLDKDGDLDLVVNNVNEKAFIIKNKAETFFNNRHLRLKLEGKSGNTEGVGAKVITYTQAGVQVQEQFPTRGFQSSVEPILHFGFVNRAGNEHTFVDSLRVIWQDGTTQMLKNININQTLVLKQREAKSTWDYRKNPFQIRLIQSDIEWDSLNANVNNGIFFQNITNKLNLIYNHIQTPITDFNDNNLIPYALSTENPKITVADFNRDGLTDFGLSAASNLPEQLFIQSKNNEFTLSKNIASSSYDKWALFAKKLTKSNSFLLKTGDFDGDGKEDAFISVPPTSKQYGVPSNNFLIKNINDSLQNVTPQYFEGQDTLGMVTDAVWTDLNNDKRLDLVVIGAWMPITFFFNRDDHFEKLEIENTASCWQSIAASDMDKDGDIDLIIGNMGLNTAWKASAAHPMRLYLKDFNNDGNVEPLITHVPQGIEWLFQGRDDVEKRIPLVQKQFSSYTTFAQSPFDKIFSNNILQGAIKKEIQQLASLYLENRGGEGFELKILPNEAQISTVKGILTDDFDGDGFMDIAIGGNAYDIQPAMSRFDASYGTILKGNGRGDFTTVPTNKTNFILKGAVRDMKKVGDYIIVSANNAPLQIFELKTKKQK